MIPIILMDNSPAQIKKITNIFLVAEQRNLLGPSSLFIFLAMKHSC